MQYELNLYFWKIIHTVINLQILPVSLRNVEMNAEVRTCIMRVSRVFRRLCSRTVNMSKEQEYIEDANETLCMIEREFPLGSMVIMTHLSCASHGGALYMRPSSKPLDVSNGAIHEDP